MNQTTVREMHLRTLTRHIAHARQAAQYQLTQREMATRLHGAGHPQSIAASHRLNSARSSHRELQRLYRATAGELARIKGHEPARIGRVLEAAQW